MEGMQPTSALCSVRKESNELSSTEPVLEAPDLIETSPRIKARVAGIFYTVIVLTALYAHYLGRGTHFGHAAGLVSDGAYLVVALLLYELFKPVNRSLSLLAALFGVVEIARADDGLFFHGVYCILLGYLIYRSTFVPRALGVLMALAGLGLLVNDPLDLLPSGMTHVVSNIGFSLDGIGEIGFTLWLLIIGVNVQKWEAAAIHGSGTSR